MDQEQHQQLGLSNRFFKFIHSKSLDTKLGRRMMVGSFGPEALQIYDILVQEGIKRFGSAETFQLCKIILRSIQKTRVACSIMQLNVSHSVQVQEPILDFLFQIFLYLGTFTQKKDEKKPSSSAPQDLNQLTKSLENCFALWTTILTPFVSPKSILNLQSASARLLDREFLSSTLSQIPCAPLQNLVSKYPISTGELDVYCTESTCGSLAVPPRGLFLGSNLCDKHLSEKRTRLSSLGPTLDTLLTPAYRKYVHRSLPNGHPLSVVFTRMCIEYDLVHSASRSARARLSCQLASLAPCDQHVCDQLSSVLHTSVEWDRLLWEQAGSWYTDGK
jgi:hypothetical protein